MCFWRTTPPSAPTSTGRRSRGSPAIRPPLACPPWRPFRRRLSRCRGTPARLRFAHGRTRGLAARAPHNSLVSLPKKPLAEAKGVRPPPPSGTKSPAASATGSFACRGIHIFRRSATLLSRGFPRRVHRLVTEWLKRRSGSIGDTQNANRAPFDDKCRVLYTSVHYFLANGES